MKRLLSFSILLYLLFSKSAECYHPQYPMQRTSKLGMGTCSQKDDDGRQTPQKKLYPFKEARRIARGHGFQTKQEFLDYECPGAYQLPKNPQEVWSSDWVSWDDWLGIVYNFDDGRRIARELAQRMKLTSMEDYLNIFEQKKLDDDDPACRLPYRPDLKFKDEWVSWDDWLGH